MIDKYIINEIRYLYLNKAILTLLDFENHQMYLHQEQGILQGPLYEYYQHLIDQLGLTERIRETYEVQSVSGQLEHRRKKRQALIIGVIGGLVVGGIMEHERINHMEQAIDELDQRTRELTDEMVDIQGQMISLTKTTMKEFEKVKSAINQTNQRLDYIALEIAQMEEVELEITKDIEQLHYALYYLAYIVGSFFPAVERKLSMYEYMMTEIEFLMDAMDSLNDGVISHKLIEPMNFQ